MNFEKDLRHSGVISFEVALQFRSVEPANEKRDDSHEDVHELLLSRFYDKRGDYGESEHDDDVNVGVIIFDLEATELRRANDAKWC